MQNIPDFVSIIGKTRMNESTLGWVYVVNLLIRSVVRAVTTSDIKYSMKMHPVKSAGFWCASYYYTYLPFLNHNEIPTSPSLMFGIRSTQWHTKGTDVRGIRAKYSCDSELVYAAFRDESIGVFDATACLQLRCRIALSAYSPSHYLCPEYMYLHPNPCQSFSFSAQLQ